MDDVEEDAGTAEFELMRLWFLSWALDFYFDSASGVGEAGYVGLSFESEADEATGSTASGPGVIAPESDV